MLNSYIATLQPLRLEIKVLKLFKLSKFCYLCGVSDCLLDADFLICSSEETRPKIREGKIRGSTSNRAMVCFTFCSQPTSFSLFSCCFWHIRLAIVKLFGVQLNVNLQRKIQFCFSCYFSFSYHLSTLKCQMLQIWRSLQSSLNTFLGVWCASPFTKSKLWYASVPRCGVQLFLWFNISPADVIWENKYVFVYLFSCFSVLVFICIASWCVIFLQDTCEFVFRVCLHLELSDPGTQSAADMHIVIF